MKKITFILFAIFSLTIAQAQTFETPVEYLEFLGKENNIIARKSWRLTHAIAHAKSDRTVSARRKQLVKSVDKAIDKITKAEAYANSPFKGQVLEMLELKKNILTDDIAKVIDMKEIAEQSYDLMEAYVLAREAVEEKQLEAQQQYEKNYYAYAAQNNIKITESESDLGKKMGISSLVFDHYNEMYLIYFKVRINEIYLLESLKNNDVSGIQQNASALKEEALAGIEKLKTTKPYKTDKALILATTKAFQNYVKLADEEITVITDFIVAQEDFNKIKESLDKTPQKKRTKEMVADFNKKVKEINKGVTAYNKANESLINKLNSNIQSLNNVNERYLDKHIPKD